MARFVRKTANVGDVALPPFHPVEVQSLADRVYWQFLQAILSGKIERDQVLPQEWLAKQFGVSRTPLREALMRLASEGLVRLEANRGARVTGLDFGDMQHAWRARLVLEPGAARLAACERDERAIERMELAIQRQRETVANIEQSLVANREFHLALVAGSRNPYLIRFSEMLWTFQIAAPIFGRQARDPHEVLAWAEDHQRIVEAIRKGDPDSAEELTRRHIAAYPPPDRRQDVDTAGAGVKGETMAHNSKPARRRRSR